jgi:hypothetical protein
MDDDLLNTKETYTLYHSAKKKKKNSRRPTSLLIYKQAEKSKARA